MAQNITFMGASYTDVPAVNLPKTGGGTARFTDTTGTTASESDVASGETFIKADGSTATGTLVFVTYRTGSGTPASSLGSDGDIYLKVVT